MSAWENWILLNVCLEPEYKIWVGHCNTANWCTLVFITGWCSSIVAKLVVDFICKYQSLLCSHSKRESATAYAVCILKSFAWFESHRLIQCASCTYIEDHLSYSMCSTWGEEPTVYTGNRHCNKVFLWSLEWDSLCLFLPCVLFDVLNIICSEI